MATQKDIANKLGMFQPDVSRWSKRIAEDIESCMIGSARKILRERGETIKVVKIKRKG